MTVGGQIGHLTDAGRSATAVWDAWLGHVVRAGLETAGGD
jgi:hypothetical protein